MSPLQASGKKVIVVGLLMIIAMIMATTVYCSTTTEQQSTTLEIYSPNALSGAIDMSDKSSVQNMAVVANSTAVALFNYQYVSINSIGAYGWLYYYVDLAPYATVSITHYTAYSNNRLEIYMEHLTKPTMYSYSQKNYITTSTSTLTSNSKTYSNRVYIAIRNANSFASSLCNFSVKVTSGSAPNPTPTPGTTYVYRTNSSLSLALGIPSLILSFILFVVVIAQSKRMAALTKRVTDLEKKLSFPTTQCDEMMPPVMMNIPLMSANTLQQDHEEIQQVIPQPQPTAVAQQQPTTIPQFFPQFVQHQALPPQFRNAQPYPFTTTPPQFVFAQQQPQVVQQPQVMPQQVVGQQQTQTKQ